jgi:hypothetical protein
MHGHKQYPEPVYSACGIELQSKRLCICCCRNCNWFRTPTSCTVTLSGVTVSGFRLLPAFLEVTYSLADRRLTAVLRAMNGFWCSTHMECCCSGCGSTISSGSFKQIRYCDWGDTWCCYGCWQTHRRAWRMRYMRVYTSARSDPLRSSLPLYGTAWVIVRQNRGTLTGFRVGKLRDQHADEEPSGHASGVISTRLSRGLEAAQQSILAQTGRSLLIVTEATHGSTTVNSSCRQVGIMARSIFRYQIG